MKIATFNINNVNRRLPNLLQWLKAAKPDVVCLQELKCTDDDFPAEALAKAGYAAVWRGQRTWNGVAILSRGAEPVLTRTELPGDPADVQARYIEAAVGGILIGCIYLPNGNPQPGPKFDYKLAWFKRLAAHARKLLREDVPVVLAGDYNVAPTEIDIYPTTSWDDDALIQPREPLGLRAPAEAGLDRRPARAASRRARLHVLALPAPSLGAQRRTAHRSPAAQPVACPSPRSGRRRSHGARQARRQRSRAGLDRTCLVEIALAPSQLVGYLGLVLGGMATQVACASTDSGLLAGGRLPGDPSVDHFNRIGVEGDHVGAERRRQAPEDRTEPKELRRLGRGIAQRAGQRHTKIAHRVAHRGCHVERGAGECAVGARAAPIAHGHLLAVEHEALPASADRWHGVGHQHRAGRAAQRKA